MDQVNKAIQVKNLSFRYGKHSILKNVNIDIEKGKLVFILGPNGSGKSTFLRLLAGLLRCKPNEIFIYGNDANKLKFSERAYLVGFLNQQHTVVFPFTVENVVITGRAAYVNYLPKESDKLAAVHAIEKMGIIHLRNRIFSELSGGEQQLVMIARLLAQNPKILLLDEPVSHLDFNNQAYLLSLLKKLTNEGITILATIHDPNLAFLYGDDFLFVKDKNIIRSDEKVDAWSVEFLREIYNCNIKAIPFNGKALLIPYFN